MSLTFTFLGTGTSAGVPVIGCECPTCVSEDPRDRRDRPSALVRYSDEAGASRTILIDTGPDLRHQMLRAGVTALDGVLYTHNHAGQMAGRLVSAMERVIEWMRRTFAYVFEPAKNINPGSFVAQVVPHAVSADETFGVAGRLWTPLRLMHGRLPILGFRVGGLAYCTDCSSIPPETLPLLEDLDTLVLDGLRYRHHPTHLTVDRALEIISDLRPRRAFLTHIAHDILHADLEPRLPENVFLAHDGLTLEVEAGPSQTATRSSSNSAI